MIDIHNNMYKYMFEVTKEVFVKKCDIDFESQFVLTATLSVIMDRKRKYLVIKKIIAL